MSILSFDGEMKPNDTLTPGSNNSYLVKRKSGGGSQFSKDPMNLMNKYSRKVCNTLGLQT